MYLLIIIQHASALLPHQVPGSLPSETPVSSGYPGLAKVFDTIWHGGCGCEMGRDTGLRLLKAQCEANVVLNHWMFACNVCPGLVFVPWDTFNSLCGCICFLFETHLSCYSLDNSNREDGHRHVLARRNMSIDATVALYTAEHLHGCQCHSVPGMCRGNAIDVLFSEDLGHNVLMMNSKCHTFFSTKSFLGGEPP